MTRARVAPILLAACALAACKAHPAPAADAPPAWSPAVRVNARADARSVALALDAQGRAVVTWMSVDDRGTRAMVATECAGGAAWTVEELSRGLDGRSSAPTIAAGPDGRAIAAWTQSARPNASTVLVRERARGAWGAAEALSLPPDAYEPQVAMTAAGDAYVVWSQGGDAPYSVQLAQKRGGEGDAWDRPASTDARLSPRALSVNQPRIAVADGGELLVTWYQSPDNGPLMAFMSERRGGAARPGRTAVDAFFSPRGGLVDLPVPALGPNGSAAVAWTQESSKGARSLFVATRDGRSGSWSRPADRDAPLAAANDARAPLVAFGPAGDLFVAWGERAPERAVFAMHRDASGAWDAGGPTRLSDPAAEALDPAMAVGPDGAVLVVWSEKAGPSASQTAGAARTWRAVARARASAAALARDLAKTRPSASARAHNVWGAPVVLSAEGANAVAPVVAIAKTGRAVVAWSETPRDAPAAPGFVTVRSLERTAQTTARSLERTSQTTARSLERASRRAKSDKRPGTSKGQTS